MNTLPHWPFCSVIEAISTGAAVAAHVIYPELLRQGVIIAKYLCNMPLLTTVVPAIFGLPVELPASVGAPARVIAIEDV